MGDIDGMKIISRTACYVPASRKRREVLIAQTGIDLETLAEPPVVLQEKSALSEKS
jgi:hypothetical protein